LDGTEVFFARDRLSAPIWKVSVRGGQESMVGTFHITGRCQNFAVGAEGICYVLSTDPERWFELWLYRFATGKSELIRRIEKRHGRGLSVSPDGRWLVFSADEAQYGDLYMVENFR
jgi:Tol biopolymer transport system component